MITDIAGIRVGHHTDAVAQTGCTVIVFPDNTVASGEVRGGAPATREFALLDPTRMVQRIDAVVLSGGSAFGLASVDGVMIELATRGRGFETVGGVVPIVIGLGLFDLGVGDGSVRPTAADGRAASRDAMATADHAVIDLGRVGAGTGATVDKWREVEHRRSGGLVGATLRRGDVVVSTLIACNAYGSPGLDAAVVAAYETEAAPEPADSFANTTIGVVVTNARLDKTACHLASQSAHDGLARSVAPSHTAADGDAFVAAATGTVDAEVAMVRNMTVAVVEMAVASLAE